MCWFFRDERLHSSSNGFRIWAVRKVGDDVTSRVQLLRVWWRRVRLADARCPSLPPRRSRARRFLSPKPPESPGDADRPHFSEGDDLPYPALADPSLGWEAELQAEASPCLRSFCPNCGEPSHLLRHNPFLSICPSTVPLLWCQHQLSEKAADVPLISIYSRF